MVEECGEGGADSAGTWPLTSSVVTPSPADVPVTTDDVEFVGTTAGCVVFVGTGVEVVAAAAAVVVTVGV